jgi:hypothetical protein
MRRWRRRHGRSRKHLTPWEALEAGIDDGGFLKVDSSWMTMQPPQLITCEELEMLEPHLSEGLSLVSLLREKIASSQFNHRSMKDFLLRGYRLKGIPNREIDRLYTEAFDLVRTLVQPHLREAWGTAVNENVG